LFNTSDDFLVNGLSQVDLILNLSNIIKNKNITNYYGDYYSNNINKYIQLVNKIVTKYGYQTYYEDDIDTPGDDSYLNIDIEFNNIIDIIDSRFMPYNLNYIKKQIYNGNSEVDVHISNIKQLIDKNIEDPYYLNILYFIYNSLGSAYNMINKKITYKSKFLQIDELDNYISSLKSKKYNINFSYNDVEMINNLKYYLFNQSPFKRNIKVIEIIKEVDEAFVLNMKLYNIKDAFTKLRSNLISIDTFYDLCVQAYYYGEKDQLKTYINNIEKYNNNKFNFSIFLN